MSDSRYTVEIIEGAEADLLGIYEYLVQHDAATVADRLLDSLLERADSLETFPLRGSIPDEAQAIGRSDVRQTLVLPYRLLYIVGTSVVTVFLVADGRRDMRGLLQQRLLMLDTGDS